MPGKDEDNGLDAELESRLNDLFGEDDKFAHTDDSGRKAADDYPLAELKNIVLSIDWEITDEVLHSFLQQTRDLKSTFKEDPVCQTFLQILQSLGEYIRTNRGKAHPRTFKILNSVFSSFDRVVLGKNMSAVEKKKILRAEMKKYRELREQIARQKVARARQKKKIRAASPPTETAEAQRKLEAEVGAGRPAAAEGEEEKVVAADTAADAMSDPLKTALEQAVEEIKRFIHAEIASLKKELSRSARGDE